MSCRLMIMAMTLTVHIIMITQITCFGRKSAICITSTAKALAMVWLLNAFGGGLEPAALAQTVHPHEHAHYSESHQHPHDQEHAHHPGEHYHPHDPHGHDHSHLPVDYSFRPDAGHYIPPEPDHDGFFWWKGNLHAHTLWSDGDQFPEVVTEWYYKHGYHFLAISDHNTLLRGQKWINPETSRFAARGGGDPVFELYRERFGDDWIETRHVDNAIEVRLKPLNEVRALFEKAGRFIMIESEEITEREHNIHTNATNILELIEPVTGSSVEETIRLNIDAVVEQSERTGREMIPHLNHPNFRSAVTTEHMAPVENLRLFELYNGHRGVHNFGADDGVKDLERVWDIILTRRLAELGLDLVYGIATDDAHNYEASTSDVSRPGRGWVMVRTKFLTPESIVRALQSGNFYAGTGVTIASVETDQNGYSVQVEPEEGVNYTIQFIGTRKGYDPASRPFVDANGQARNDRSRLYSDDIGVVLKEVKGTSATYSYEGDELYVRARVISSKPKENYFVEGEVEKAWMQPVQPGQ